MTHFDDLERFLFSASLIIGKHCKTLILMATKLPDEFNKVIKALNPLKKYNIDEAYFDELEHRIDNGLRPLRAYLGLPKVKRVCDGFCKINFVGMGTKNILLEDKATSGERHLWEAHDQFTETSKALHTKYGIRADFAIITELKIPRTFEAMPYRDTNLKYIRTSVGKRPQLLVKHDNAVECPILIGRN
jgi:hypothetical protein